MAVGLVDLVVEFISLEKTLIIAEADEILTTPTLPAEFEEAFVEECFLTDDTQGHAHTGADEIQIVLSAAIVAELGFCPHQHDIGKAEEHNVVVHQFAAALGILVDGVFLHAGTGCFKVGRIAEIHHNIPGLVHEWVAGTVGDRLVVTIVDRARPVVQVETFILVGCVVVKDLQSSGCGADTVLTRKAVGCRMAVMPRAVEVFLNIGIEIFVEDDGPDVLRGGSPVPRCGHNSRWWLPRHSSTRH